MTVKTMEDLFLETLKDIYYAEKHILKALPGMVKKAGSRKLKEALETHRKETEGQIDRLDQVFRLSTWLRAARSARRSKASSMKPRSIWRRSTTSRCSMPA